MKTRMLVWVALACLSLGVVALAQDKQDDSGAEKKQGNPPAQINHKFYRLDYVLREMDGAKEISKRNYMLTTRTDGNMNDLRTGNRVPINTAEKQIQYIDVGVNIDTQVKESAGGLWLSARAEMSSVAPEMGSSGVPIIRQTKGDGNIPLTPGKSALVFSADDPSTTRRFELSVTATELK